MQLCQTGKPIRTVSVAAVTAGFGRYILPIIRLPDGAGWKPGKRMVAHWSVGVHGFEWGMQRRDLGVICIWVHILGNSLTLLMAARPRLSKLLHGSAGGPQVGQIFQGQERKKMFCQGFLQSRVYQEHGVCRRMLGTHNRREALCRNLQSDWHMS